MLYIERTGLAAVHEWPKLKANLGAAASGRVLLAEVAEAKRVGSGENLAVLIPDDAGTFYMGDAGYGGRLTCTNPVQTWLDLRHVGGRGNEAAEAV